MTRRKMSVLQVAADIFFLLLVLLGPVLYYTIGHPTKRGFYCDDETIQYPYKDDTVSDAFLYIISVVIPFILILSSEIIRFKFFRSNRLENSFRSELYYTVHKVCMAFLFGAAITQFIVDITKYNVGRLRPHFLAVCEPDKTKFNCSDGYITADVCLGADEHKIKHARLSFPSGHAALTLYGMIYLMLYIQSRVTWRSVLLLKPLLLSGCFLVGVYVSVTRIFDYKHHPWDVAVGALIGTTVALIFSLLVENLGPKKICRGDNGSFSADKQPNLVNNAGSRDTNISIIT